MEAKDTRKNSISYRAGYESGLADAADIATQQAYEAGLDMGRLQRTKEIVALLEEWEDNDLDEFDSAMIIAANRGHLWPWVKVIKSRYGIE